MISAQMVKELRDNTGAGLMDCKNALTQANGDVKEAEKILKKMGLAAVAKRADRATDNGRIAVCSSDSGCAMVSVACETDFVAKNEDFKKMCDEVAKIALDNKSDKVDSKIEDKINSLISVIKENMSVKKLIFVPLSKSQGISTYIHGDGAMGAIVRFNATANSTFSNSSVKNFMHDVALHVTAYQPQYLRKEDIDEKYKAEQLEIFKAQVASLDKPEKVKEGIINGKMNKLGDEICLLDQAFVKDPSLSVSKALSDLNKKEKTDLSVVDFYFLRAGV